LSEFEICILWRNFNEPKIKIKTSTNLNQSAQLNSNHPERPIPQPYIVGFMKSKR